MGGGRSRHEHHVTIVDNSEAQRAAARRAEEERLRRERERRETEERARIEREAREKQEREKRRLEEEIRRRKAEEEALQRKRRRKEEEALKLKLQKQRELDAKSSSLRTSLCQYKFGNELGSAAFDELSVSDMTQLRIAMFGPTGSGKSCFINTCEKSVRQADRGSAPESSTGGEGTIVLEDYLPEMFFKLVDTRGFFNYNDDESGEFRDILAGRIKSGDVIRRGDPARASCEEAPFVDALHGVIFVLKANDIRLQNESLKKYLNPMREIILKSGISPVTVVTHRDKLSSPAEREAALKQAAAATGSTRCNTFLIANYCHDNSTRRAETEIEAFQILHAALAQAETFVKNFKQERREQAEQALIEARSKPCKGVGEVEIDVFLAILRSRGAPFSDNGRVILQNLRENDIHNLQMLAECWKDVDQEAFIPGRDTRRMIHQELRQIRLISAT